MTPDLFPDGHTVSQETLDRLAELDAAATPGPWALDGPWWWENEHCTAVVTDAQRLAVCIEPPPPSDPTLAHANVALIVAMRNALPALIAAARNNPQPLLDVEQACEIMHDAYEAAAIAAGWETQERSRKSWSDVPEANKEAMRRAVAATAPAIAAWARRAAIEEFRSVLWGLGLPAVWHVKVENALVALRDRKESA